MLRPEALQTYVRERPFRPFLIEMLNGKVYEIRHPELIRVGRDFFVWFDASPPDAPANAFETVSLVHIQSIRHVDRAATQIENGE